MKEQALNVGQLMSERREDAVKMHETSKNDRKMKIKHEKNQRIRFKDKIWTICLGFLKERTITWNILITPEGETYAEQALIKSSKDNGWLTSLGSLPKRSCLQRKWKKKTIRDMH